MLVWSEMFHWTSEPKQSVVISTVTDWPFGIISKFVDCKSLVLFWSLDPFVLVHVIFKEWLPVPKVCDGSDTVSKDPWVRDPFQLIVWVAPLSYWYDIVADVNVWLP